MKKAIISGATGVIGMALINELINNNVEVLVLCRENSWRNTRIPENSLVSKKFCNLENLEMLENDTDKEYDVFYHFAWEGTTGESRNDMYIQNKNVKYTLDAVNAAKKFGCKVFIGAGSQAEYGICEGLLKPETPAFPCTGYGMAKLCAGYMSRYKAQSEGLKHIWVRVLSVYGPYDNENSMVASTIRKLKDNVIPEFTKGEQNWDYIYSRDAAAAFFLLGDKGIDGKTYVLGSGKIRKLKDYIEIIHKVVNPNAAVAIGALEYAKNQVMHLQADITELCEDTGFKIKTDFEEGIKETLLYI